MMHSAALSLIVLLLCSPAFAWQKKPRRADKPNAPKTQPTLSEERVRIFRELAEPKDEWIEATSNRNARFLYNPTRISKTSTGTVKIWIKEVPRPELGFRVSWEGEQIERRKKIGESTEGYEQISHILTLYEIDCDKSQVRILTIVDYKADGAVLDSWAMRGEGQWRAVIPESVGETFANKACQ